MKDEFSPPINTRSTDELLDLVSEQSKWEKRAVDLAKKELDKRNVKSESIAQRRYIIEKKDKIENLKIANESYSPLDFIFEPFWTMLEIIFGWNLEKDGYLKKAKQRKKILPVLVILILFFVLLLTGL